MKINGYAAQSAKSALAKLAYDPHGLGPHDVEVNISHCGICHSDIHLIDNDWGVSSYPLIPGHEIIGTVTELGAEVRHLSKGQRVGIGWQRSACMECEWCVAGDENLCRQNQATCVGHHGGFADRIRTDGRFAFPIPDALSSENAAPLLCGGVTVFSPLRNHGITASHRVGVIGIGGLGHLALQFARALGCEVTAFSTSPDKETEARSFGANHFIATKDAAAMKKAEGSIDFLLSTVSGELDWPHYLALLRPKGTLCVVGASPSAISVSPGQLISGAKTICGSPIGSRTVMREMLDIAARHGIEAKTEIMKMPDVNAALDKVRAGKARYRMVLENA